MGFPSAIYPRIFAPFLLALIIGSLSAWWLASSLFASTLQSQREQQLENAVNVLAQGNLPLTPDLLGRLGRVLQADLVLIRPDGTLANSASALLENSLRRELENAWGNRKAERYAGISQIDGSPYSILIRPLAGSGESRWGGDSRYSAIVAIAGLSQLRQASGNMALRLGLGLVVGTLLLAWLVHRITRGLTGPIGQLSELADRISGGELKARADIKKPKELAQLAGTLNDMADQLQQYQRKIVERNRLKALGEMAARMAHEIRNPLTAIKLQIQLLGEGEALQGEAQQKRIKRLLDEIRRLELIVSGTLMMGKALEIAPRLTDLNTLAGEVMELMQPQLAHRGIIIESTLSPIPSTWVDPDRIRQVLFNLINNATDELRQGGIIRVSSGLRHRGQMIELVVEDSGPGIPEMQWERLFEESTSGKPHGLGIGLVISRELLERHQGTIRADRSPTLGGARFHLLLPVKTDPRGADE